MAIDHQTQAEGAYQRELAAIEDGERDYELDGDDRPAMTTTDDGYLVDESTGEIVGMAEPIDEAADRKALVEAYLERRARAEAKRKALQHEMNLLIAGICERFETQIREQERKVVWLDGRFRDQARQFAMEELAYSGKAGKSLKTAWGTLSFRKSRESTKVLDPVKAFAFLALSDDPDMPGCWQALKLEFDLGQISDQAEQAQLTVLADALLTGPNADAVKPSVLVSRIPEEIKASLPEDAFEHHPSGAEQIFEINHGGEGK
jgi:phage host-nuclease inhibitor protein Gam